MQKYPGNTELAARISSYELAYRMQGCAPERRRRRPANRTPRKKLYGLDDKITEPFGRQCLMARRLVEHGVRFVQIFAGGVGNQNTDTWDAHGDIKANHTQHAAETDLPDRRPADRSEGARSARHDAGDLALASSAACRSRSAASAAITTRARRRSGWPAPASRAARSIGSTDEFGYKAEEQPISYHDLHATMLHLLGIDHTKLTYRFNGRDMRLTDVYGTLIPAQRRRLPDAAAASISKYG